MPGTGPLRRSSRADRIKAIVGKSRIEAALRRGIQNSPKTQLLGGERRRVPPPLRIALRASRTRTSTRDEDDFPKPFATCFLCTTFNHAPEGRGLPLLVDRV